LHLDLINRIYFQLIQRRYLEALIGYWSSSKNNPISKLTGAPMIDISATSVWAWDARPFPDFPAREDVWSDGANWQRGHWINGRVGAVSLQDVIEDICEDAGLDNPDVSSVTGLVSGFLIDRPMRARDALSIKRAVRFTFRLMIIWCHYGMRD